MRQNRLTRTWLAFLILCFALQSNSLFAQEHQAKASGPSANPDTVTARMLRAQVIPTPRQQGADSEEAKTKATLRPHSGAKAPYWSWLRLLGRVFDLDLSNCPFCRRGALHIISAITQEEVTDPHLAASQAGVCAAAHCPCPTSIRGIRL